MSIINKKTRVILINQSLVCSVLTPPFTIKSVSLVPEQNGNEKQEGMGWLFWHHPQLLTLETRASVQGTGQDFLLETRL